MMKRQRQRQRKLKLKRVNMETHNIPYNQIWNNESYIANDVRLNIAQQMSSVYDIMSPIIIIVCDDI